MQISAATAELTQSLGRSPTPRELAEPIGCTRRGDHRGPRVEQRLLHALASTPATTPTTAPPTHARRARRRRRGPRARRDPRVDQAAARRASTPREKRILLLRFFKNMTQSQIAEEIGVSQMHVSRLLTRTLDAAARLARGRTSRPTAASLGRRRAPRCSAGCSTPASTTSATTASTDGDQRGLAAAEAPGEPELDQLGEHDRAARPGAAAVTAQAQTQQRRAVRREEHRRGEPHGRAGRAVRLAISSTASSDQHDAPRRPPARRPPTSGGGVRRTARRGHGWSLGAPISATDVADAVTAVTEATLQRGCFTIQLLPRWTMRS